jgi:alanine racemase
VKSWVEIATGRLAENLRAVEQVAGEGVEVLAVIKANGYGHAATIVAPVLVQAGARWMGVTDLEEGRAVREAVGPTPRLLVMCGMETSDAAGMLAADLTPVLWTVDHVQAMEAAAADLGARFAVHLEIDTGMARQGAAAGAELDEVLARLARSRHLFCEGVMSHLSSSEVAGAAVTAAQVKRFAEALAQVEAAGVRPRLLHLGNTSAVDEGATMEWIKAQAESMGARPMVRTGLALYGDCLPVEDGTARLRDKLRPVMTWKTRVIGRRDIGIGDTVGYGATFLAARPMRLALLPVGYADGFRREASWGIGDGWVMIDGKHAPVIGRVSMNLMTVDVTEMEVSVGDEVVLLGDGVSAADHARWCGTIPYEILCGVRARNVLV